ncbi:hypothetical protein LEM8419_00620 [Neolewinella maritima]|uniref:Uncharacterized protein n=1 Tax=Neolewinella maritima TaxID=1383882 RepID=A0ABM9AY07_9BACT|nr:hypothetical protein LEM8419_00620 [Neolewinella maritima]
MCSKRMMGLKIYLYNTGSQTFLYYMWNDASTKFGDLKPISPIIPL